MGTYGKKTGGKDFEPGNPGGPGRPRITEELKALRQQLTADLCDLISDLAQMSHTDLKQFIANPTTTAYELLIASCFAKGISGSLPHVQLILDRTLGPVPKPIELTGEDGDPIKQEIEVTIRDIRADEA